MYSSPMCGTVEEGETEGLEVEMVVWRVRAVDGSGVVSGFVQIS